MTDIVIQVGDEKFPAELADDCAPETVRRILEALPIEAQAMTWGDEIYFEIPVDMPPENAQTRVTKGALAYWPAGNCFCIFYGRTPMSPSEEEIVPASAVNVIGSIQNADALKKHAAGETVTIGLAE